MRKETTIEETINTTEEGETVVLIETKRIEYVKRGRGLRAIKMERLKTEREFNEFHHQPE